MKSKKPVPYSLSQWGSMTEIFYICPKCGCDLRMLGNIQNYCHQCGVKFDWKHLPKYCSDEFKERWDKLTQMHNEDKISFDEMKNAQKEMMFEIYEKACNEDKDNL